MAASTALAKRDITLDENSQRQIELVKNLYAMMMTLKSDLLQPDIDYGVIPGTGDKPTLYLPGMEKVMRALNTVPDYRDVSRIEDFEKGLFHYEFECTLIDVETGKPVPGGRGRGSCNSYESSFRWRWVTEDKLPQGIDKSTLESRNASISEFKFAVEKAETAGQYGKPAEYWQQFQDAIEDGTARLIQRQTRNGKMMDAWEIGGYSYRIQNPDIADQVNAIMKRAKKRALGDAVKGAAAISEFFTVDVEDFEVIVENPVTPRKPDLKIVDKPDVVDGEIIEDEPPTTTTTPKQPWATASNIATLVKSFNENNQTALGSATITPAYFAEMAGVTDHNDMDQWVAKYETGKEAYAAVYESWKRGGLTRIQERIERENQQTPMDFIEAAAKQAQKPVESATDTACITSVVKSKKDDKECVVTISKFSDGTVEKFTKTIAEMHTFLSNEIINVIEGEGKWSTSECAYEVVLTYDDMGIASDFKPVVRADNIPF